MSILMWVGVVVGLILVVLVAPLIWMMFAGTEPEGVAVDIACPPIISAGEQFDIVVSVTNLLDRPRTLFSLDLDHSLLKGFEIQSLTPEPQDCSSALGTTAHYYNAPIAPRGSIGIAHRCRARSAGEFSGNFLAFVDHRHGKSMDKSLRLVVK